VILADLVHRIRLLRQGTRIMESMAEDVYTVAQPRGRHVSIFWSSQVAGLVLLLSFASCASVDSFRSVYYLAADFFSLGGTAIAKWLLANSGFGHFIGYALLCAALIGALPRRLHWLAPVLAGSFGLLMEIAQIFVPSRGPGLLDVGINLLGIVVVYGFYRYSKWKFFKLH
jgi:hypothetical protein